MTLWNEQTSRRNRSGAVQDRNDSAEAAVDSSAREDGGRPLSRRAAREKERRAAESLAEGQQHPSGVLDFGSHSLARDFGVDETLDEHSTADIWEALSRRAEAPPAPVDAPEAVVPPAPLTAEPAPASLAPAPAPSIASVAEGAAPEPVPGVRRRGRRAAAVAPAAAPVVAQQPAAAQPAATVVADAPARHESPAAAPAAAVDVHDVFAAPIDYPAPLTGGQPTIAPVTDDLIERVRDAVIRDRTEPAAPTPTAPARPLTRRELRARKAAETVDGMPAAWFAGDPDATPAAEAPPAFSGASDTDGGYLDIATVQMSAVDRATLDAHAPMIGAPTTAPVDLPHLFSQPIGRDEIAFSSPVLPVEAEPLAAHPGAVAQPVFVEPEPQVAEAEAHAEPDEDRTDLAGFEALISRSRGRATAVPDQTGSTRRTAAAWQSPLDADDQHAGFAGLLSRNVGLVHGSQNALILEQDPQPDVTKAVNGTGELFITGSLNLSRTLATTGATPDHYDALEIDRLFEASQDEPAANVAPVRASRAVSSGPATGTISPRRTRSSVLPMVLAIVAGVMALGVICLIAGSWLVGAI